MATKDFTPNLKKDFPLLQKKKDLVYLDNAATTQKPAVVLEAMDDFYKKDYAPVHRGLYDLSARATEKYEAVREKCQKFINGKYTKEIIFTHGATDAINMVADSLSTVLKPNDRIVISEIEHHANFVPWQQLAKKIGLDLQLAPVDDEGFPILKEWEKLIDEKTKLVAIPHISNVFGSVFPIEEIAKIARLHDALLLVDGAQAVAHTKIDVQKLDCDFYLFSAHKMYGPTGIGVLYGKKKILESLPPSRFGGHMTESIGEKETTFAPLPAKFEAGTPPIAEAIGLGVAIDYLEKIGLENIQKHEEALALYANQTLREIADLKIFSAEKSNIISFNVGGIHSHDLATILAEKNICIRAGHHCSIPSMKKMKETAVARASLGLYNEKADIDKLKKAIIEAKKIFS